MLFIGTKLELYICKRNIETSLRTEGVKFKTVPKFRNHQIGAGIVYRLYAL